MVVDDGLYVDDSNNNIVCPFIPDIHTWFECIAFLDNPKPVSLYIDFYPLAAGFRVDGAKMGFKIRYNNSYMDKNKILNMRTFNYALIFGFFFLLFLMPVKSANIFNVTGQTANVLDTNYGTGLVGKQRMFCDVNYCYHIYDSRNADGGTAFQWYITKWIRNSTYPFTTLLTSNSFQEFNPTSYSTSPNSLAFDVMDYDNDKFYMVWVNATNRCLNRYWVYKENLTLVKDIDVPDPCTSDPYYMTEVELGESFSVIYTNNSGIWSKPNIIKKLYFTPGNINLTLAQYYKHVHNINYLFIPEINEKYLFFSNETTAYLYRLNSGDSVITYYDISTGHVVNKDDYITPNALYQTKSIYAYYYNNLVYFAIRQYRSSTNDNNNTWYINVINPTETRNSGSLKLLGSGQYLDLSLYDTNVGNSTHNTTNQTTALSFYYDDYPGHEQWYILYQRQYAFSNYGGKEIMFLPTFKSCLCSDWINASQCGYDGNGFRTPNVLWQSRSCTPSQCDSLGQFIDCEEAAPIIHNYTVSDCGYCSSTVDMSKSTTVNCVANVTIPVTCSNITTTATRTMTVDWGLLNPFGGLFVGTSYFNTSVCNPPYRCLYGSYLCREQDNSSDQYSFVDWTAGQNAVASFSIDGSNCYYSKYLGWQEMTVEGKICYTCQKTCGGTVCENVGSNWYAIQQASDCSYNRTCEFENPSPCLCQYGCSNGQCLGGVGVGIQGLQGLQGNIFDIFFSMITNTFTGTALMFLALMLNTVITGTVYIETKSTDLSIICFIAFLLFFSFMNWIPYWFGITIMIISVLFLSRKLFVKGG